MEATAVLSAASIVALVAAVALGNARLFGWCPSVDMVDFVKVRTFDITTRVMNVYKEFFVAWC